MVSVTAWNVARRSMSDRHEFVYENSLLISVVTGRVTFGMVTETGKRSYWGKDRFGG